MLSLLFVCESQFEWRVWPLVGVRGAFIFPWEKFNFGKCCHSALSVTLVQLPHQSWRQQKSYLKIQNVSRVTLELGAIYWINHQEKIKFKKKRENLRRKKNNLIGNATRIILADQKLLGIEKRGVNIENLCPLSWSLSTLERIWQELNSTAKTRNNISNQANPVMRNITVIDKYLKIFILSLSQDRILQFLSDPVPLADQISSK